MRIFLLFLISFSLLNASTSDTASTSTDSEDYRAILLDAYSDSEDYRAIFSDTDSESATTSEATPEKQIQPLSFLRICINNIAKRAHNRHCGRTHWKGLPEELSEPLKEAYWKWARNIHTLEGHAGIVSSLCFNPKGNKVCSVSTDKTVRVWDVLTGQEVATLMVEDLVHSVSLNPSGTMICIVCGDECKATLFDVQTNEITELHHDKEVRQAKFSPDGTKICLKDSSCLAFVYDVTTKKKINELIGHWDTLKSISFSPDGTMMACTALNSKTIRLWDAKMEKWKKTFSDKIVLSVEFSPDNSKICSRTIDSVTLWDIKTGKETVNFKGDPSVFSSSFSPDGTMKLVMSGYSMKLFRVDDGEKIASFSNDSHLGSAVFSPNGTMICTGDFNGAVKLWGVPSE